MRKQLLALNLLWIAIASGTFYAGSLWREGTAAAPAPARNVTLASSGGPLGSASGSGAASRADDGADEFMERFGLNSGTPLSAEMMSKAVAEALRESNPIRSQMLFGRLMEALTPENAPSVLAMLRENVSGFDSMRYTGMLAYAWGGLDPKAAMEQLSEGGDRGGRFTQGSALAGWAGQDPKGAIAWLETYEGRDKDNLTQSLIGGLAKSDFEAAMKFAGALEDNGERSRAAESLAREMIRTGGVEKATAWLASLTDPRMKAGAFDTVAQQMMRSDPKQAEKFIRKHAGEEYAVNAARSLAADLSRKDVNQGLEFAGSLSGQAQSRAYGEVISRWMGQDNGAGSVAASEYVSKMAAGPARDAGAAIIAREMIREDPAASIAWAASIGDAEQREQTLVMAGRRYLRSNPEEGAAWLAGSGLSTEAQQQILTPREDRGDQGGGPFDGGRRQFGGGGRDRGR